MPVLRARGPEGQFPGMTRTRTPGDGPRCWCGELATFGGSCSSHFDTDTGQHTRPPRTTRAQLSEEQKALLDQVAGFALRRKVITLQACAVALGWKVARVASVMLELQALELVLGPEQKPGGRRS